MRYRAEYGPILAGTAAAALNVRDSSIPEPDLIFLGPSILLWLLALTLCLRLLLRRTFSGGALHRWWTLAAFLPVFAAVAGVRVFGTDLTGFEYSRSDLQRLAETGKAGDAGIYRVVRAPIREKNGLVRLPTSTGGMFSSCGYLWVECGFIYAPTGIPPGYLEHEVEYFEAWPLGGPWFRYEIQES